MDLVESTNIYIVAVTKSTKVTICTIITICNKLKNCSIKSINAAITINLPVVQG